MKRMVACLFLLVLTAGAEEPVKDLFLMATRKGIVVVDSSGGSSVLIEGSYRNA